MSNLYHIVFMYPTMPCMLLNIRHFLLLTRKKWKQLYENFHFSYTWHIYMCTYLHPLGSRWASFKYSKLISCLCSSSILFTSTQVFEPPINLNFLPYFPNCAILMDSSTYCTNIFRSLPWCSLLFLFPFLVKYLNTTIVPHPHLTLTHCLQSICHPSPLKVI